MKLPRNLTGAQLIKALAISATSQLAKQAAMYAWPINFPKNITSPCRCMIR